MARNSGKKVRNQHINLVTNDISAKNFSERFPQLEAQSYHQQDYIHAIKSKDVVFALGSAGSGKSYVATHYAAEQLYYKKIDKIILTRPAVEACGEQLGFLPGN